MIQCTFEDGNEATLRHVTVDCLVVKDGRILLTKRSKGLIEAGKWCLPGGFMKHGETTEMAIIREVMEETGTTLTNIHLLRVNDKPDRPHEKDRQNVDFIFFAQVAKETSQHDWETEARQWFPLDKLPPREEIAFDHQDSIDLYKKYIKKPFPLPVIG